MTTAPPVLKLAVALIVAAGLAFALWPASGSPLSREAYAERLMEVVGDWPAPPGDPGALADFADGLEGRAAELGEIVPPREIRPEHERLVAATGAQAAALRSVVAATSPATAQQAAPAMAAAAAEWAAAMQAIADRGYATIAR